MSLDDAWDFIRDLPSPAVAATVAVLCVILCRLLVMKFMPKKKYWLIHLPILVGIISFSLMHWVAAHYITRPSPEKIMTALSEEYGIFPIIFDTFPRSRGDFLTHITKIQDVDAPDEELLLQTQSLSITMIDKYYFRSVPRASNETILAMLQNSYDTNVSLQDNPMACMAFELANPSQALKILPKDVIKKQIAAKAEVIKSSRGAPSYAYVMNKADFYDALVFQFLKSGGTEETLVNVSNLPALAPQEICETSRLFYETFLRMPPEIAVMLYKNLNMP